MLSTETSLVNSFEIVSVGNDGDTVKQPSTGSGTLARGTSVKYGYNDYASRNQPEYNKVMTIIDAAVAEIPNTQIDNGGR